ncbi:hypothetical protein ACFS7Z_02980 [Pontibacter toksunensis]|uniref:SpoIIAA-like protein n=1 Tax=Pontibacter toksunensis TaxID=1332631 RepID=A0ABW6BQP2_9BACT
MPFETKYESAFYKIEVDKDIRLLQARWLRPVTAEELEIGGTKLFEILLETQAEKVVANAQLLGALSPEAKEWLSSRFFELLSQTQLKMLARVLPENMFHRISLESVVTRAEALGVTNFQVKNFSLQEEALEWLGH